MHKRARLKAEEEVRLSLEEIWISEEEKENPWLEAEEEACLVEDAIKIQGRRGGVRMYICRRRGTSC